jgi:hypothetical protein
MTHTTTTRPTLTLAFRAFRDAPTASHWRALEAAMLAHQQADFDAKQARTADKWQAFYAAQAVHTATA